MNISIDINEQDFELIASVVKEMSGGYPTDDSDETIVRNSVIEFLRSKVQAHQALLEVKAVKLH